MDARLAGPSIKDFFADVLRASFADLDIADRGSVQYLADLLGRFALTDELCPLDQVGGRLRTLTDRLAEIQRSWDLGSRHFDPTREVEIRRGIAEYTLFMSGFFWEAVRGAGATRHFVRQGRRAYRFLAEYYRALHRPEAQVYATVAARFETYAAVLSYMRDVHLGAEFAAWPHKIFARII
jgi:hypothetical protein